MNKEEKICLLVAYINSHMPELIRAALFLKANGFNATFLYVNVDEPVRQDFLKICLENNIPVIDEFNRPLKLGKKYLNKMNSNKINEDFYQKKRNSFIQIIKKFSLFYTLSLALYNKFIPFMKMGNIIRRMKYAKHILVDIKPNILIFAEENASYQTSIYVKAAQKRKIASVIFPYTIANAVETAEHVHNNSHYEVKGLINFLVSFLFPKWVFEFKEKKLLAQPSIYIVLSELLNLSPPDPWMINSGFADAIAVESKFMMNYYLTNGLPKDKMYLTGSFSDDTLFKYRSNKINKRNRLYRELGITNKNPMLLCAIPPPFFPREECEFNNFKQLIEFWIRILANVQKYNIIVSLHPRLDAKKMTYIEKKGIKIASWTAAELIPLCNVYIANVSATIRWAIACGIPVLNYDVYKYRFHDFDTAKGVITVENKKDFKKYLDKMTIDEEFLIHLQEKQKNSMKEWGNIDGKSGNRILKLVRDLSQN